MLRSVKALQDVQPRHGQGSAGREGSAGDGGARSPACLRMHTYESSNALKGILRDTYCFAAQALKRLCCSSSRISLFWTSWTSRWAWTKTMTGMTTRTWSHPAASRGWSTSSIEGHRRLSTHGGDVVHLSSAAGETQSSGGARCMYRRATILYGLL